ncbi:MAG: sigma-54 dependent transcriptional regulator [Candidatus Bostrichicola ureolyticus]|nr:MAG: sigma-54 dependent transcriptional regulator [Candidatus Bostrichicola ureolyticus]
MHNLIQNIKHRYGIIGNDYMLYKSLEKTILIAPTDISVMVVGESGVGKEFIPKIIHQLSSRKHNVYIAINCGAIPEGTINSELFGHEKGAFTGANNSRKGYFEVANGGTIFLDEIGELPLSTQIRLLRILESGEFIKVGSSKVQKTNVRIVSATNINLIEAINNKKFREDLYYRINTIQIDIPPLRYRKGDINILFNKFSNDFSEKYNITPIKLTEEAVNYIEQYHWNGNIRQLRNVVEQLSILEKNKISLEKIKEYIPTNSSLIIKKDTNYIEEKKFLYKALFNMRKDLNNLKILILQLIRNNNNATIFLKKNSQLIEKIFGNKIFSFLNNEKNFSIEKIYQLEHITNNNDLNSNESLFIKEKELEFIRKALTKNNGNRKIASQELGISERTLYRKIKEYGL